MLNKIIASLLLFLMIFAPMASLADLAQCPNGEALAKFLYTLKKKKQTGYINVNKRKWVFHLDARRMNPKKPNAFEGMLLLTQQGFIDCSYDQISLTLLLTNGHITPVKGSKTKWEKMFHEEWECLSTKEDDCQFNID